MRPSAYSTLALPVIDGGSSTSMTTIVKVTLSLRPHGSVAVTTTSYDCLLSKSSSWLDLSSPTEASGTVKEEASGPLREYVKASPSRSVAVTVATVVESSLFSTTLPVSASAGNVGDLLGTTLRILSEPPPLEVVMYRAPSGPSIGVRSLP